MLVKGGSGTSNRTMKKLPQIALLPCGTGHSSPTVPQGLASPPRGACEIQWDCGTPAYIGCRYRRSPKERTLCSGRPDELNSAQNDEVAGVKIPPGRRKKKLLLRRIPCGHVIRNSQDAPKRLCRIHHRKTSGNDEDILVGKDRNALHHSAERRAESDEITSIAHLRSEDPARMGSF